MNCIFCGKELVKTSTCSILNGDNIYMCECGYIESKEFSFEDLIEMFQSVSVPYETTNLNVSI